MSGEAFVSQIAPLVQKYAPEYGIRCCSGVIAQASVNMTTQEEFEAGTLTTITDNFRVFGSMEEGVKGYFEFIQLDRYSNLRGIEDPRTYLQTLRDDGYATSSSSVVSTVTPD